MTEHAPQRPPWLNDIVASRLNWKSIAHVDVSTAGDVISKGRAQGIYSTVDAEKAEDDFLSNILGESLSIDDFGPVDEYEEVFPQAAKRNSDLILKARESAVESELDYLRHSVDWADEAKRAYEELESFCSKHAIQISDYDKERIFERTSSLGNRPSRKGPPADWLRQEPPKADNNEDEARIADMFALL